MYGSGSLGHLAFAKNTEDYILHEAMFLENSLGATEFREFLNAAASHGDHPLQCAVHRGYMRVASYFLAAGATARPGLLCAARLNKTAFFDAVEQHGAALFTLAGLWEYGADALSVAAQHGSLEVVEWILARSESVLPQTEDMNQLRAFMLAAATSKSVDVIEAMAAGLAARYPGRVTEASLYQSAFVTQMHTVVRTCGGDMTAHILARLGPQAEAAAGQRNGQDSLLDAVASADPFVPGAAAGSVASARVILSALTPEAGRGLIVSPDFCSMAVSSAAVLRNEQLVRFLLQQLVTRVDPRDTAAAARATDAATDSVTAAAQAQSEASTAASHALGVLLLKDVGVDRDAAIGTVAHAATRTVLDHLLQTAVGAPLAQTLRSPSLLRQLWALVMAPRTNADLGLALVRAGTPSGLVLTESETAHSLRIVAQAQSSLPAVQLIVAAALASAPGTLMLRLPLWRSIIANISLTRKWLPWPRWRTATQTEIVPPTAEFCTCTDHKDRYATQQAALAATAFLDPGARAFDDDWTDVVDAGGFLASHAAEPAELDGEAGAALRVHDDLARARIVGAILRAAASDNARRELVLPAEDAVETRSALNGALSHALPALAGVLLRAGADPLAPVQNKSPLTAAITATAVELLPDTLHARTGACIALLKRFAFARTDNEDAGVQDTESSPSSRWADAVRSSRVLFAAASAANAPALRELCADAAVASLLCSNASALLHALCSMSPYQQPSGAAHVRDAFAVLYAAIRSAYVATAPQGVNADVHADTRWAQVLTTPTKPLRCVTINACSFAASRPNAFTTALMLIEAGAECSSESPTATTTVLHALLHPGRVMRGDTQTSDISGPLKCILHAVQEAAELRQRYAQLIKIASVM
jgi:ankyrin repeat protein